MVTNDLPGFVEYIKVQSHKKVTHHSPRVPQGTSISPRATTGAQYITHSHCKGTVSVQITYTLFEVPMGPERFLEKVVVNSHKKFAHHCSRDY